MNKEDFTTIGTFVQKFKKRARKVHGISEEAQCVIFLGLLTASEAIELTRHGGGSTKLTWTTIDRGVEVGCLDQVEQRQVRLQRQKRKERDATASGTPGVTRIVTDVLAQLGYATEPVVQKRVVTAVQVKGTEPVIEEAVQEELWEEEESVPQRLTKAQRKEGETMKNTPPVDGFLDQEEDVRLHINKWSPRVPSCVGYPIWQAPNGYERRAELVLKPFEEEDPWGGKNVQWMMELTLTSSHSLVEDMRTIEEGPGQVERHEDLMGGMYLLVNTLLQENLDQSGSLNPTGNVDEVPESQDDEFEEGEIKEAFRAEEYDGIYLELGLLLSCEMRLRDVSDRAQRMLQCYLMRDDHLFVRREVGNLRRVVCGRNRQIDVVAGLHDDIGGVHRGVQATYAKISALYYWDEMMDMVGKSDFTKKIMPRGGKGTRPPQRPLGASGGYERHGPRRRESTPEYDGDDIELFLDSFWEHVRRMGWTMTQRIERLRGVGRFEEPVARIHREATTRSEVELRMQELRPLPVGPDGRPIRLEIRNASDFIPAFEWFMQGQGIPRDDWMQTLPLWTRKAERPLARQRQRDPEPREARPSRGGGKALARREEEPEPEPEAEERGAYPECGLGPVEFHWFIEGGLRRSPAHTQEEPPASEGPLRESETHLDISRWRASPRVEEHGEQAEEVPREEVTREEVPQEEVPREEVPQKERSEAAGALPGQPPSAPARAPEIAEMWRDFWEQRGEELPSPVRAGFGVARKAEERLDRKIKFPAKTTFDRHLLLEGDLAGKKIKEASHGVRLEAMEMEIQELRALVASQAAIIESLRQQTQGKVDKPESSRQGEQRQPGHGLPGQPSAAEPRQGPPTGRVILEPEEARAQRQAEREAFEFRSPTELATLPVAAADPVVPLAVEEGRPPSSSEPAQGSAEGSMGVLLEAVHTMQKEVSLFSPEQRIEEPLEREMGIETEGAIEGGP
ncbi:hypothetical protein CBR_g22910 [Chara braunii]|uniref:Integrase zinc-binding domain-containing protein n=1 Tax=Chara braunii TaxID=69332 RepID=A0A388L367_CHABU|nr:hypothetical protein CBR_g22910 [Chara braunii]|eukprot:GBG76692.1 hypothetical protein CBR_g22910 [Chara braunii]